MRKINTFFKTQTKTLKNNDPDVIVIFKTPS